MFNKLLRPVDAASLVFFRIVFGFILAIESIRYLTHNWIYQYYLAPEFHFKYYGFEWIEPWPGIGLYLHFIILGILAFMIMIGLFYRFACILYFVLFTYIFLLDQTYYLNHFYLVILTVFLMCFLPLGNYFSVDALRKPESARPTVPQWALWAMLLHFEILLLYAGIVKINYDWLHLQPLTIWLTHRADYPILGPLLAQSWFIALASYGTIILHCLGAPLLFWRKTRLWVFLLYAVFHLTNAFIFDIGIFPWMTLFGTLIFFEPDWPRTLLAKIKRASKKNILPKKLIEKENPFLLMPSTHWILGALAVFFIYQVFFPLRHYLYPGDVSWTEEGHRFSWHMKMRGKSARARFYIFDPDTNRQWKINPNLYLSRRQTNKMASRPDMILQFAHYLDKKWRIEQGVRDPEVSATVTASLNGRQPALLIDPNRDLSRVERNLKSADWILPLNEPLPKSRADTFGIANNE